MVKLLEASVKNVNCEVFSMTFWQGQIKHSVIFENQTLVLCHTVQNCHFLASCLTTQSVDFHVCKNLTKIFTRQHPDTEIPTAPTLCQKDLMREERSIAFLREFVVFSCIRDLGIGASSLPYRSSPFPFWEQPHSFYLVSRYSWHSYSQA